MDLQRSTYNAICPIEHEMGCDEDRQTEGLLSLAGVTAQHRENHKACKGRVPSRQWPKLPLTLTYMYTMY